jgi:endoglucanase
LADASGASILAATGRQLVETLDLLRTLSDAFGVVGTEDEIRSTIEGLIAPLVDEVRTDTLGNLLATRKGKGSFTLMLDAHMDEVGFLVKWIDDRGYLRFVPLGGWDERIVGGHRVEILLRSGVKQLGVIGSAPPHILKDEERKKPIPIEGLFIDIGARSREEAEERGVRIGDPLTIHYPFAELAPGTVTGKALDDRAGCAVLIEVARRLAKKPLNVNLAFSFAVGEEVGQRGAKTAAYQIEPDAALAIEGTIGADMPGVPEESQPVRLGCGPAITVADRSIVVSRRVVQALERAAEGAGVPYQYKLPIYGGTDAGAIHLSRSGVLAGVVSVPCRFIHSPTSTLRLSDFEQTVKLVTQFVRDLPKALL